MGEIGRQASMLAYVDSFRVLFMLAVAIAPLSLLLKMARARVQQGARRWSTLTDAGFRLARA
jgi:hypothetical protein